MPIRGLRSPKRISLIVLTSTPGSAMGLPSSSRTGGKDIQMAVASTTISAARSQPSNQSSRSKMIDKDRQERPYNVILDIVREKPGENLTINRGYTPRPTLPPRRALQSPSPQPETSSELLSEFAKRMREFLEKKGKEWSKDCARQDHNP
ncbi:hypothetical protein BDK51DRAFT_49336 [Blyttiomyces helicus]|uniref:Uncharacterized protein n=1 Tax=Blyttiomyces helicus TaxID=388810 RepID=A0A4V1IQ12_9FUNG|nr:hypothetical protein BDK51DRAFT_49336 [Blyttiomyces helicus]|eukprot:RKO84947.1 hypothetical protein BDK51DRAFT_49336 [Blyttiomyces helicus]